MVVSYPVGRLVASLLTVLACQAWAELRLPALIGDHMVLQQQQVNPVWAWGTPGAKIVVTFAGRTYSTMAGKDGRWMLELDVAAASSVPQVLTIAGISKREIQDVLVGEVWLSSGQSNMAFRLRDAWDGDIESAAAKLSNIRMVSVPPMGSRELREDFKGEWKIASPETVRDFSAISFLFGRCLHEILGVPVGLINNSWGGSGAAAWVRWKSLEGDSRFRGLLEKTRQRDAELSGADALFKYEQELAKWKESRAHRQPALPMPVSPLAWLNGNRRPGNAFNSLFNPLLGWAELREAQTRALRLPRTGQAVIIDLGDGKDIHSRNKTDVAVRLARRALGNGYGVQVAYRSPEFKGMEITRGLPLTAFRTDAISISKPEAEGNSAQSTGAHEAE